MPRLRERNGFTYWWVAGEICTARHMSPPEVYELPPDLPAGTRVRLLEFTPGIWRVERADQPGGPTWRVFMTLLEPDEVTTPPPPRFRPRGQTAPDPPVG